MGLNLGPLLMIFYKQRQFKLFLVCMENGRKKLVLKWLIALDFCYLEEIQEHPMILLKFWGTSPLEVQTHFQ